MRNINHILPQNHKLNINNDTFIFFDTETQEHITKKDEMGYLEKDLTLKLGWGICWNRKTGEEKRHFFKTSKSFWDWVEKQNKKTLYVLGHNTGFDFRVVEGSTELIEKRGYTVDRNTNGNGVFNLEISKKDKKIIFWDTTNYVKIPLEEVGESLGYPKLEIDFNKCSLKELKTYCLRDTEIVYRFLQTFLDFLEKHDLSKLKTTISATALNTFKHRFNNEKTNPIYIHAWENAVILERKSYRGGISDCLKVGKFKGELKKLDVNSMYPEIMRNNKLPNKLIYYGNKETGKDLKQILLNHIKDFHVIADVEIELPEKYAHILTHGTPLDGFKKCMFLQGTFRETIGTPEIEYVLKHGKIKKIYELSVYTKEYIFTEYIDFFYNKRLEYAESNPCFALLCKSFMNNLSGKFGQKQYHQTLITKESKTKKIGGWTDYQHDIKDNLIEKQYVQFNRTLWEVKKPDGNARDSFVAISSIITSFARMKLINFMEIAKKENCYYCDTDSLIVNLGGFKNLSKWVDKNKLGYLKVEGTSHISEFIAPKFYVFEDESKCKGVRKNKVKLDGSIIERHQVLEDNDKELVVRQDQFQSFNSSIKKNNTSCIKVKNITKRIKKFYDKGVVDKQGCITPYFLSDLK